MLIAMEYFNPHICLFYDLFFYLWFISVGMAVQGRDSL
jgi:hypothetical protein